MDDGIAADALDEDQLHRSLGRFLARHVAAGLVPDPRMFTDLLRIVAEYSLAVPPEMAAVFRSLATAEGTLTRLAPGFDMVAETRCLAGRYLAEQLRPGSLRELAADELTTLLPMLTSAITLYQFLGFGLLVIAAILALRVLVAVLRPEGD